MSKMFRYLIYLIFVCIVIIKCEIINRKVFQVIDVTSQLVKIDQVIYFQNVHWNNYVNVYNFVLDPGVNGHYVKFKTVLNTTLSFQKYVNESTIGYNVFLDRALHPKEMYEIKVELVLFDRITPFIKGGPYRRVEVALYRGNILFYSPYRTLLLEKEFIVIDSTKVKKTYPPYSQKDNNLRYVFSDINEFQYIQLELLFTCKNMFLIVTDLKRTIDVSHFGKICIKDEINILNNGSKLLGPYEPTLQESLADRWWYTHLPTSAEEIEYYDTLGNNSKSKLLKYETHNTLKFQLRYPLLSGWKSFYIISYCVPMYEYLYRTKKGQYNLKIRVIDHVLDDVIIRQATVKVLLPEGSEIITTATPENFQLLEYQKEFTNLCTFGRPTVILNGSNILENHINNLTVKYLFPMLYLFRLPLLFCVSIECVFIVTIFVRHFPYY